MKKMEEKTILVSWIKALDSGFSIKDTIEKRTGFSTNEGNTLIRSFYCSENSIRISIVSDISEIKLFHLVRYI